MTGFWNVLSNKQAVFGMTMVAAIIICAVFAPLLAPNDPMKVDIAKRFVKASAEFPLGTDQLGRCILSRLLFGARYSLGIAGTILLLTSLISIITGMIAAYYGGISDRIFLGICDLLMAFPTLVFVLVLVSVLGLGLVNLMFSMVFANWVWYARIVRSHVLMERNKNYVMAAKAAGSSDSVIMIKHILPNIAPALIVFFSLGVAHNVLMVSGFSFLGLGVEAELPEWGSMLSNAKNMIYTQPHLMFYPGMCIFFTVCSFNILGEALRDIVSPDA